MPFLHSPAVLRNWPAGHGNSTESQEIHSSKQRSPNLRSTHSIARLIDLVRNPIENVGELVENWYEGSTRDERAKQQNRDEARQIWYLRLGEVRQAEIGRLRDRDTDIVCTGYELRGLESGRDETG